MECKYNKDEICTNAECPMCADYCPVPNYEGVCKYEQREDATYLTPKGCLFAALLSSQVCLCDELVNEIWENFQTLMLQHGYVKECD